MSRIPKWKVERTKVKVVFRLQIHATHIPQPGWDKLFVSFIPADTGKPTAKTTKASVRNGNCKWSDPIYETTRLLQDPLTKKYDEKFYKLVVAMGSSRSSVLGEVTINLADFADASKPYSVTLPLHGSDFGTVLHVTVQLLTSKTGFREFEQQRELSVKGFQTLPGQKSHRPAGFVTASSEITNEQIDKVNTRVRFKEDSMELPSLEEVGESNEDYEDSAAGIDGSSNTSESLYAEKNDISTAHEVDSLRSTTSGDGGGLFPGQSPRAVEGDHSDIRLLTQRSNDWTHGWSSDYSVDNDLATAYEENNRLRVRLEVAESAFLQVKTEADSLQCITDELGTEMQSLVEQLALELASGQKLTEEVSILKSDCSKFKSDLEVLKSAKVQCIPCNTFPSDALSANQDNFFHDLQIKWLHGFSLIEGKVQEIQKACLENRPTNFDFLHSDFQDIDCILQNIKEGLRQESSSDMVEGTPLKEFRPTRAMKSVRKALQSEEFIQGEGLGGSYTGHYPEGMNHHLSNSHPLKKNVDAASTAEDKMCELLKKLEESKTEKENLMKKMDQMECYYEALIQELEESRQQTVNELESLRTEHSPCLYTISTLQNQIEKLHQDMNEQFVRFAEDKHDLDSLNRELEKRATATESALKRVRRNYATAVDRLQKDLELLSFQVLSMYETNENLAKQAFTDGSQLFDYSYLEDGSEEQCRPGMNIDHEMSRINNGVSDKVSYKTIDNSDFIEENKTVFQRGLPMNVGLQTKDEGNIHENGLRIENIEPMASQNNAVQQKNLGLHPDLSSDTSRNTELSASSTKFEPKDKSQNQYLEPHNQPFTETIGLKEMRTSLDVLKELQSEAELSEMHMVSMNWKVFGVVLQETLHDVNNGITQMKSEMIELAKQLEHSDAAKESLVFKLDSALDEARMLREEEDKFRSQCNDLMLKNHILEAKLQDFSDENTSLKQSIAEYVVKCGVNESKYENCLKERNEFDDMLKKESQQSSCLQSEIYSIVKDFKALKEEFDKQSSVNCGLQKTVCYLQEKFRDLHFSMASCSEVINCSAVDGISLEEEFKSDNYTSIFLHLERFQQGAYKKILQLRQEIEEREKERASYINSAEAQILSMRQKFESDLEEITAKLDLSNALAEKFQQELQAVAEKFKLSTEAEEKHIQKNRELSSKLTIMEIEIQQTVKENRDLTHKLLGFENIGQELEKTTSSLMDCMQQKRSLTISLESRKVQSIQMENEINSLKESLRSANDKLQLERGSREELEATVTDLTLQLKEGSQKLQAYDEQKSDLLLLRKTVVDLETEMQHFVLHAGESQRKQDGETISLRFHVADLENHLTEIIERSLSSDVEVAYMRSQFQSIMQEYVDQNKALLGDLRELYFKHLDIVASQKTCMAREAQLADENARLTTVLLSLKDKLETVDSEKEGLLDFVNKKAAMWADAEDMKTRAATVEADHSEGQRKYEDEICQLRNMLVSMEEEVDILRSSRDELEATVIILRSKLDEQKNHLALLEEWDHELKYLREQYNELTHKLSEQILKTEEFKNLSIHLRELKDKVESECLQARERRETEGSSLAMQDSLRIAFIKEQCESKLQEMRNQLCASKHYAEEMLLKLQNALDEVENVKESEASLLKRNEELTMKISDMETELQTVTTDRRELEKAYDRMKAEHECAVLSLDCCNEEKLKLEASLQECNDEGKRVRVELDLVKRLLENMSSSTAGVESTKKHEPHNHCAASIGELLEDGSSQTSVVYRKTLIAEGACSGKFTASPDGEDPDVESEKQLEKSCMLSSSGEVQDVEPECTDRRSHQNLQQNLRVSQDGSVIRSTSERESLVENTTKQIANAKEHFKEQQRLMSSMDLFYKELERLKHDNLSSILPLEDPHVGPASQGLQRELSELYTANEQLGSIFPLFKQLPGSGNALERVLALELELAEALQAKKSSDIHLQSSFLKQHNDEEAVFQSFKDINELIKDMLELKKRNTAVETELKEMQGRYSQLSLQFAEVEGERQKLVMTLKNRSPKKS